MSSSGVWQLISDEFSKVKLDRKVVIGNRRLGIVYKVLQTCSLCVIVFIIVVPKSWRKEYDPKPYDMTLWRESGPSSAYEASNVRHCNVSEYRFDWSATWSYAPSECRLLPTRQLFRKEGSNVYHPTYIDESMNWKGECSDHNRNACLFEFPDATYSEAHGECHCTAKEQYFVKNQEESRILFLHGAIIELDNGWKAKGKLDADHHVLVAPDGSETILHGPMITVFEKPDGSQCSLDGRSEWQGSEAGLGVGGSLKELLACADITLDSDPQLLNVNGKPAPHLRTMGLILELRINFQYPSPRHDGILAVVHVVPRPVWNSVKVIEYKPRVGSLSNGSAEVEKYMYGISQRFVVDGSYYRFNGYSLMTSIVNAFVVWSIPRAVLELIALYFVGKVSSIFRKVVHQPFNIYKAIADSFSKLMVSSMAFRCMKNAGFRGPASNIPGISKQEIDFWVRDVFKGGIDSGQLCERELDNISSFIIVEHEQLEGNQMTHQDGVVSFAEFCATSVSQDPLSTADMVRFLDADSRRSCLESLFDDTAQRISVAAKQDAKNRSGLIDIDIDQPPSAGENRPGMNRNQGKGDSDAAVDLPAWAKDYIESVPTNRAHLQSPREGRFASSCSNERG